MNATALFSDMRATRRFDAALRAERSALARERRAARRPESSGDAIFGALLAGLFRLVPVLFKWVVPMVGAICLPSSSMALVVVPCVYAFFAPGIVGSSAVDWSAFEALRHPSRLGATAARLVRRAPLLASWGVASAIAFHRLATDLHFLVVAAFLAPFGFAFVGARSEAAKKAGVRPRKPIATNTILAVVVAGGGILAAVGAYHGVVTLGVVAAVLVAANLGYGAFAAFDLPKILRVADVAGEPLHLETSTAVQRRPTIGATPASPGAGLLRAHIAERVEDLRSMRGRAFVATAFLALLFGVFLPAAVVLCADDATWVSFQMIVGVYLVAVTPNILRVRHPHRLALFGVSPRKLRLYGFGSYLLAVVLPVAIGAVVAYVLVDHPHPVWSGAYAASAAILVLRAGWDGLELLGRDESAGRKWSLPLRFLGAASVIAAFTPVGPLPAAAVGVAGVAALVARLDAPIHGDEE